MTRATLPALSSPSDHGMTSSTFRGPFERKRIAIVGAGTGGLAALAAILDLPLAARQGWSVVVFEQRQASGGIWLQDPDRVPALDGLPQTPAYDGLRTNTVVPTMTFPGRPYPPDTPLFAPARHIQEYHETFISERGLAPFIRYSSSILKATYDIEWKLRISTLRAVEDLTFDHLIVASGHNHFPFRPSFSGQADWLATAHLASAPLRWIEHSASYRRPEEYEDKNVLVVGFSASGSDIVTQLIGHAFQVYHSFEREPRQGHRPSPPAISGAITLPIISHFSRDAIHFNGSNVPPLKMPRDKEFVVLLATGYRFEVPFLDGRILQSAASPTPASILNGSGRYISPLHRQIFAIPPAPRSPSSSFPMTALAFVGAPLPVANMPSSYAQGLYIAHALATQEARLEFLPTAGEALEELRRDEERLERQMGRSVADIGHQFPTEEHAVRYTDDLIEAVFRGSAYPLPTRIQARLARGEAYTEPWRLRFRTVGGGALSARRGWLRAEELGMTTRDFGRKGGEGDEGSEAWWVGVVERVIAWEEGRAARE